MVVACRSLLFNHIFTIYNYQLHHNQFHRKSCKFSYNRRAVITSINSNNLRSNLFTYIQWSLCLLLYQSINYQQGIICGLNSNSIFSKEILNKTTIKFFIMRSWMYCASSLHLLNRLQLTVILKSKMFIWMN